MIIKIGSKLIKEAFILGSITGGVRAGNLSDEQRKALKRIWFV